MISKDTDVDSNLMLSSMVIRSFLLLYATFFLQAIVAIVPISSTLIRKRKLFQERDFEIDISSQLVSNSQLPSVLNVECKSWIISTQELWDVELSTQLNLRFKILSDPFYICKYIRIHPIFNFSQNFKKFQMFLDFFRDFQKILEFSRNFNKILEISKKIKNLEISRICSKFQ